MLTPRQQDHAFPRDNLRRWLRWVIGGFVFGLLLFVLPIGWVKGLLPLVFAFVGYLVASRAERQALIHYHCPNCKAEIGHDTSAWREGVPIVFLCPNCKLEWDTGLKSGKPSGAIDERPRA